MTDCAFCAVAAGRGDTETLCEDAQAVAFFPRNPATAGHTLVVPRTHYRDIWEVPADTYRHLGDMTLKVAHAVRAALHPLGLNVISSTGATASQTVFHLHIHVVPRYQSDRMNPFWPTPQPTPPATQAAIASLLRAKLSTPS